MKQSFLAKLIALALLCTALTGCGSRTSGNSIPTVFDIPSNKKDNTQAPKVSAQPEAPHSETNSSSQESENAVEAAEHPINQCQLEVIGEMSLAALRVTGPSATAKKLIAEYDQTSKENHSFYLNIIAKIARTALAGVANGARVEKMLATVEATESPTGKINLIGESWKNILSLLSEDESTQNAIAAFDQTSKIDKGLLIAATGELAKQALPLVAKNIDSHYYQTAFDNCK
jgi:hypothetical protein